MKTIKLPQLEWHGRRELTLDVPDSWDIEICNIAGHDQAALHDVEIKRIISNPLAMPPLKEIARGKKEVVILFDDLSRGTRPANIIPHILAELAQAGIDDNCIRFICALGAHAPLNRSEIAAKLGEDIVTRYAIFNHNAFDNCIYVGTTSYGTKVYVNAEFMQCDLKIAIGSMVPHPFTVFGGGGKIILPGICSIETMMANHSLPLTNEERADYNINSRRLDMEEAASFVKLDMLVECIINMWGDTVSLCAGAPEPVRQAAFDMAQKHYLAPRAVNKDIVILNAYHKANEAGVAMKLGFGSITRKGGDVVLIASAPGGQVQHYLMGAWGKLDEGQHRKYKITRQTNPLPDHVNHIIRYDEYPMNDNMTRIQPAGKQVNVANWQDAMKILTRAHPDGARVAVYPNADVAYIK